MSNRTTVGILIALIALLGVFYYVTNLGVPKPPPPPPVITSQEMWQRAFAIACKPARGNAKADWTVIEIGDFQCPICGRSRKYVETMIDKSEGKVNLYFINYPLQMHEFGQPAAAAALAAESQGKFWAMYDALYSHQDNLSPRGITTSAMAAGLDMAKFKKALSSQSLMKRLYEQHGIADDLRVSATPTFVVHRAGSKDFKVYVGLWPQADLGNSPGLRQLMLDTPWGVKMAAADIPPAKSTDK